MNIIKLILFNDFFFFLNQPVQYKAQFSKGRIAAREVIFTIIIFFTSPFLAVEREVCVCVCVLCVCRGGGKERQGGKN